MHLEYFSCLFWSEMRKVQHSFGIYFLIFDKKSDRWKKTVLEWVVVTNEWKTKCDGDECANRLTWVCMFMCVSVSWSQLLLTIRNIIIILSPIFFSLPFLLFFLLYVFFFLSFLAHFLCKCLIHFYFTFWLKIAASCVTHIHTRIWRNHCLIYVHFSLFLTLSSCECLSFFHFCHICSDRNFFSPFCMKIGR